MPPKLGMGVNTAIQSAQNLAWKLATVLKGHAPPQLLATYEAERHPIGVLASEQSLVGPAASVLTRGSDDKLLEARKRVSLFSLICWLPLSLPGRFPRRRELTLSRTDRVAGEPQPTRRAARYAAAARVGRAAWRAHFDARSD